MPHGGARVPPPSSKCPSGRTPSRRPSSAGPSAAPLPSPALSRPPEPPPPPVGHGGADGVRFGGRPGTARALASRRDAGLRRAEPHPGGEGGERDRIG